MTPHSFNGNKQRMTQHSFALKTDAASARFPTQEPRWG